jgi:hypothetical protein
VAPKKATTKKIPKAAGLKICLPLNLIMYFERIEKAAARENNHQLRDEAKTKPTINPLINGLSLILNFFFCRKQSRQSMPTAVTRAIKLFIKRRVLNFSKERNLKKRIRNKKSRN